MNEFRQITEHWSGELYERDGWQIIELKPDNEGQSDPYQLAEATWKLVADWQPPMLVLDMADVSFMSSALMGNLVRLHKRVAVAGGELHVARLAPHPTEALHACQLHKIIPLFDSVELAAALGN